MSSSSSSPRRSARAASISTATAALLSPPLQEWVAGITPQALAEILTSMYNSMTGNAVGFHVPVPAVVQPQSVVIHPRSVSAPSPPAPVSAPSPPAQDYHTLLNMITGGGGSSARIGQLGENYFRDFVAAKMPGNFSVEDTSDTGHRGDFILEWIDSNMRYRIMVDVKNYSKTVSSAELEKLRRDIAESPDIDGGLLVSLHTRVARMTSPIELMEAPSARGALPLMVISSGDPVLLRQAIQLLCLSCKVHHGAAAAHHTRGAAVSGMITEILQIMTGSGRVRASLQKMATAQRKTLREVNEELTVMEARVSDRLHTVQQLMQSGPITDADNKDSAD